MKWILFLCMALPLGAWSDSGHKVVAQIALNQFKASEQEKIQAVMGDLLKISVEPDQIREISKAFFNWHFIDYPWVEEPVTELIRTVKPKDNIVWALKESRRVIQKRKGQFVGLESLFNANLVHFMGDIHQPLHCITRVTRQHPAGDHGGNLYEVYFHQKKIKLHLLWDIGFGELDKLTLEEIRSLARKIAQKYALEEKQGDAEEWAGESYQLAKTHVYQAREGQEISQDYIEKSREIIHRRLAQAGYRLAQELRGLIL